MLNLVIPLTYGWSDSHQPCGCPITSIIFCCYKKDLLITMFYPIVPSFNSHNACGGSKTLAFTTFQRNV